MKVRSIFPTDDNDDGFDECIVSVEEAINIMKATAAKVKPDFKYKDDDEALNDYIVIHWAELIPE